ncbi:chromate resistance protein ChrB domain-containing protein [Variovorax saccharolyticus]|uniref:chromate resistance protein ChrB domain-containing protein n=1 Tax=Variovorax saccharolyticus TaxID=3053516 RepID=UPI00336AA051
MNDWLVLAASLPASPSGLRVRIWRSLKSTGCGTLRDGVYILPSTAASASDLWAIEKAIHDGGADAHMLVLKARDEAQEQTFLALFDRSGPYADFAQALKQTRKTLKSAAEPELRKSLRGLDQQLQAIRATDFFPGRAASAAEAGLETLRAEIEQRLSPGEPMAASGSIERLERAAFQGRAWATRKRPWVDRLATAWLIRRFVDSSARFVWLADPGKCPKGALGFDFDGARFTHVGGKVSFEVVAQAFGLEQEPGIRRLGQLVHYIDVGGIPVDEAAGVETMVRGLQAQHDKDDALLAASFPLFDTLYTAMKVRP